MSNDNNSIVVSEIQNLIYSIRGLQVMLDTDLAEMYEVETKYLNRAVKRNIERFPEKFRFQLTEKDLANLRCQFGTSSLQLQNLTSQFLSSTYGGRRYLPYVFTEQGISMLSSVLKSKTAIEVSIRIMDAFVEMRKFIFVNAEIFQNLKNIKQEQLYHKIESDKKFERIFRALEDKSIKPKQGIFYDGQVFDAYVFVADLIKAAKESIILIDNYIDESILQLFTKRSANISVTIYTKNISKVLKQDLGKHNAQYSEIRLVEFTKSHDRFFIIDRNQLYHFGASLKDLGKKWFAFSKMDMNVMKIISMLNESIKK